SLSLTLAVTAFFSDTSVLVSSRCFLLRGTRGTGPVDERGFVDLAARGVGGRQARGVAPQAPRSVRRCRGAAKADTAQGDSVVRRARIHTGPLSAPDASRSSSNLRVATT